MHRAVSYASVLRQAKVDQFNIVATGYHYVFRFDVSVDNAHRVAVKHRTDQLFHVACRLALSEYLVGLMYYLIKQLLPFDKLHYQVDVLLIVVGLKVLYDVGVVKGVQNAYFLHYLVQLV